MIATRRLSHAAARQRVSLPLPLSALSVRDFSQQQQPQPQPQPQSAKGSSYQASAHNNYHNLGARHKPQPPGAKLSFQDAMKTLNGKKPIDNAQIIAELVAAREMDADLDLRQYLQGIQACVESDKSDLQLPFWIYEKVKAMKIVPVEVFEKLLKFCVKHRLVDPAIEIVDYFNKCGYQFTENLFSLFMTVLVKSPPSKAEHLYKVYSMYREKMKTLGWRFSAQLYMDIAVTLCKARLGQYSLEVLVDMTSAHHTPSPQLCEELLNTALFYRDVLVLRVLASWYKNDFNVRLDYGVLNRMLQISASTGDGQLALTSFQLIAMNGFNPTKNNYVFLVLALLKSDDLISAVEALQELESRGMTMTLQDYRDIKRAIVDNLTNGLHQKRDEKTNRVDDLYLALLDQHKGGQIVPQIVLDAIVNSWGKLFSVDRAFAMVQEMPVLFNLHPSTETYNSLLASASWAKFASTDMILSILDDMDSKAGEYGCAPNNLSYSILIEHLVDRNEKDIIKNVMENMEMNSIIPNGRATRRLLVFLNQNREDFPESAFEDTLRKNTALPYASAQK